MKRIQITPLRFLAYQKVKQKLEKLIDQLTERVCTEGYSEEFKQKFLQLLNNYKSLFGLKQALTTTSLCFVLGLNAQNYVRLRDSDNPFEGFDLGSYSTPALVDLDLDGDLDLVSGEYYGAIKYYRNDGSNVFTEQTGVNNPFNGINAGYFSAPTFEDIDSDGDIDLIVGEYHGVIKYYENDGSNVFTEQTGVDNPFNGIDIDGYSAPALVDIDSDGDIDLILGEDSGKIKYYENDGSNVFTEQTGVDNPFSGIDVGQHSTPTFSDLDSDGDVDLVIGELNGDINYYRNNGSNVFTKQTNTLNPFNGIDVGVYSKVTFTKADENGYLDLVSGNSFGKFFYFEMTETIPFVVQNSIVKGTSGPSADIVVTDTVYTNGNDIIIRVDFDKNVLVSGTPFIEIASIGKNANYVSGSDTPNLYFSYTIGDDEDLIGFNDPSEVLEITDSINLNGGSIQNAYNTNADLNLAPLVTNNILTSSDEMLDESTIKSLYPNPAQDVINLDLVGYSEAEILIYSNTGVEVQTTHWEKDQPIQLLPIESGLYLIKIQTNNGFLSQMFIKE